jgi:folate-binding protein YgfZ
MQTEISKNIGDLYRAAHHQSLAVAHEAPGVVMLTGQDRLDLLNRMSTNDLSDLPSGYWKRTILTNALARIVDVVTVFSRDANTMLVTSPGKAGNILAWLSGYIFFQDDVQVNLPDLDFGFWGIYGPEAGKRLVELEIAQDPPSSGKFLDPEGGIIWPVDRPAPGGLQLLLSGNAEARTAEQLDTANLPAVQEAYEILRIESGMPSPGFEITEETIPLEVGFWDEVSFSKGCYIGQEILARMESRGQIARRLVLVRLSGPLPHGSAIFDQGRIVGRLTSVANSPKLGWIGLALVKGTALEGAAFQAEDENVRVRIHDPLEGHRTHRSSAD